MFSDSKLILCFLLLFLSYCLYAQDVLVFSEESNSGDDIYYSFDDNGVINHIPQFDNMAWFGVSNNGKYFFIKEEASLFIGNILEGEIVKVVLGSQQIYDIEISNSGICYLVMDNGGNKSSLFAYGGEYKELSNIIDFSERVTSLLISDDSSLFIVKSGTFMKGSILVYKDRSVIHDISGKGIQLYDVDSGAFYFSMDDKLQECDLINLRLNVLLDREKNPNSYSYRDGSYLINDARVAFSYFEEGKDAKRIVISNTDTLEKIVITDSINDNFSTPRFWIDQIDLSRIKDMLSGK